MLLRKYLVLNLERHRDSWCNEAQLHKVDLYIASHHVQNVRFAPQRFLARGRHELIHQLQLIRRLLQVRAKYPST